MRIKIYITFLIVIAVVLSGTLFLFDAFKERDRILKKISDTEQELKEEAAPAMIKKIKPYISETDYSTLMELKDLVFCSSPNERDYSYLDLNDYILNASHSFKYGLVNDDDGAELQNIVNYMKPLTKIETDFGDYTRTVMFTISKGKMRNIEARFDERVKELRKLIDSLNSGKRLPRNKVRGKIILPKETRNLEVGEDK